MAQQSETRLCHILTDDYGLRAFGDGTSSIFGRKAGFNAIAWKLDGETGFKRDLGINFNGNTVSRKLLEPKLGAKTASLIEIGWPLIEPVESWEGESSELLRYVGPSLDAEMVSLEAMVRNPKPAHELSIGRFVRDNQLGWIEGEVQWLGRPTKATIEAQLDIDVADQEKLLAKLLAEQASWDAKARTAIIEGLYILWRDGWREDDPILSETDFANRMTVQSIGVQRGGGFDIWFEDADLFWGHGILVRGTVDGGFEPGEMHG